MAPHEVVDLTIDSDSDEHQQSPSKAILAAFQPHKQEPVSPAHYNVTANGIDGLGNDEADTEHEQELGEGSLVSLLTQEVGKRATYHDATRESRRVQELEDNEAARLKRIERAHKYQQRWLSEDGKASVGMNAYTKQLHNHELQWNPSVSTRVNIARPVLPQSPANPPVLSGAGLNIHRTPEESGSSLLTKNAQKRPLLLPGQQSTNFIPFKKARTEDGRQRLVLEDASESSVLERMSYSDEPEPPDGVPMTTLRQETHPASQSRLPRPRTLAKTERKGLSGGPNRNGVPYSPEEDALLRTLKEDGLGWDEIVSYFNGRTRGSLQVRYSTKLSRQVSETRAPTGKRGQTLSSVPTSKEQTPGVIATSRSKRQRKGGVSAMDGMVSWSSLMNKESRLLQSRSVSEEVEEVHNPLLNQDRIHPKSISRILRQRELGSTERRAWSSDRTVTEELRNHVFAGYGLQKQYHGTSGDVISLAWSVEGTHFTAGSIAITDSRSMQYNMQRNLLLGSVKRGDLQELTQHHIPRPKVDDCSNPNGLHAMAASQDPRLFMTVSATEFSPRGDRFYTAGTDRVLRAYTFKNDGHSSTKCRYTIEHTATVDILAVKPGHHGLVATGAHSASDSIAIFRCRKKSYEHRTTVSPRRKDAESMVDIFPSALKWGVAPRHQNLLLAGFSGDEEKQHAGETLLWDVEAGKPVELRAMTRNVFDISWNPLAGSASMSFAVAADPSGIKTGRGMRTAIHCFAPNQNEGRRVMTWECPALDINDLVFCPHDENLIAAGATDGSVYVWDIRYANQSQKPLHILQHGKSENVLSHDRDVELADTGVRFLSWGPTKSRVYSGSSDGIVKIWNPYRSPEGAHIDNIEPPAQLRSAVMSGSFSPDYHNLVVGTENGQINQFRLGGKATHRVKPFKLRPAPPLSVEKEEPFDAARNMIRTGQIALRPCGAMPFRQAVQGPNYQGPFFAPTANRLTEAKQALEQAMFMQNEALSKQVDTYAEEDEDITKANGKVQEARHAVHDLEQRLGQFEIAEPKAHEFQQKLRLARKERELLELQMPAEPCALDCGVLPNEDEIEDSARSELRIPGALRSTFRDAQLATAEETDLACTSCFPMDLKKRKRSLCAACRLKRTGLTSVCTRCTGPMRVDTGQAEERVCERCSFTCFRCAGALDVQDDVTTISCRSCNLEWEAGVLGYDLILRNGRRRISKSLDTSRTEQDEGAEFGTQEMEHYASLWQDKDN